MAAVAALLDSRGALLALRRTLVQGPHNVRACRSAAALRRLLDQVLLDAVVVGRKAMKNPDLLALRVMFPELTVLAYGHFRPDDGELLQRLEDRSTSITVVVEGVDDAIVGHLVHARSLTERRRALLADAPRLLRLTETIQHEAWHAVVTDGARPFSATELARQLGVSREHLSRQFGAGGAPTLKRVIDLVRVVTAAQLLVNPGYVTRDVSRLLGFASPSHLSTTARRIAGTAASTLGALGPRGVFERFIRESALSR